jgi:hypothetical protein
LLTFFSTNPNARRYFSRTCHQPLKRKFTMNTYKIHSPVSERPLRIRLVVACLAFSCATPLPAQDGQSIVPQAVGTISGEGTSGKIAKFNGTNSITNSIMTESNLKIGIGTATPASKFTVIANASSPIIFGKNNGAGAGVRGESVGGFGVVGQSGRTGVQGISTGSVGNGVFGSCNADTGVLGSTQTGTGVYGNASSSGGVGVFGKSAGGNGVEGSSPGGTAVYGNGILGVFGQGNSGGSGVYGNSNTGIGVWGDSGSSYGVYGHSINGTGVHGKGSNSGMFAEGSSYGIITYGSVGIYAAPTSGNTVAGLFGGNVQIQGNLTKTSGSFKIDHPLDPAHKYLSHSFVESPDMMNIYNGNTTTNAKGYATVTMPAYFSALNRDFRYQLTCIGGDFAQAIVARKLNEKNEFTIRTDKPNTEVSWQVTGVRQDAYAEAHRIAVETEKTGQEIGAYLHPELFGQPPEKAIGRMQEPQPPAEKIADQRKPIATAASLTN